MRKFLLIIAIIIIMISILNGCYDAREIDEVAHALTIGIDKGVSDKWRLSLQISSLKEGATGGSGTGEGSNGDQDGYETITVDAPSFFAGIDMLNVATPRKLSFTHAQSIVISEELAKDGIMGDFIAPIIRFHEIRRSAHIIVTKGNALDFLEANSPFIGTTLSKALQTIAEETGNSGFFPHVTLGDFYNNLKSTYSQPMVTMAAINDFKAFKKGGSKWGDEFKVEGDYMVGEMPRHGNNKIEYWGTALFRKDKMVAELNGLETRTLLMIKGDFQRGFFTIQDPKGPHIIIPLDVRRAKKPSVKVKFDDEKPIVDLKIYLKGDLLAVQSRLHYEADPLLSLLEDTFAKNIEDQVNALINKCKKLNVDVFGFGDVAARSFWTIDKWEEYNWNERFEDVDVKAQVEFDIKQTGTQIKSSPIPEKGDEE